MDVDRWLEELGLGQYCGAFSENAIDARLLTRLTGDDLKEIGVAAVGHRRILLDAIAAMQGENGVKPAPPPQAETGGERRQVSVLFADIVGYTALSAELDAEEIRALLDAFFAMADRAVIDHGGAVDKHIGDCVMAVFGAPVAHGNDAERAVRAAIAIRDGAHAIPARTGREVRVHVGVASGEVVAAEGGDAHREYTVTGESVNLASRLTDKARAGEILVSDAVYNAVATRFSFEAAGKFELKGFTEPLTAWRVRQPLIATGGRSRPFVGRSAEIRQFCAVLDGCTATGKGQAILLRGEPGIGKSRLIEEFQRLAADAGVPSWQGLVLDFGGDNGRAAVASLMSGLAGHVFGTGGCEDPALFELNLKEEQFEAADRAMIMDFLNLEMPDSVRTVFDAMDMDARARHARQAMVRLVNSACSRCPVLMIVEDIHWADASVLDIIAAIAETAVGQPALLIVTSRVDGDPTRTRWTIPGPLITFDLAPLSREDSLALAKSYLDTAAAQVEACVKRAAGNPLFLDQLLQHAISKSGSSVPDTVQSLVQARMDLLPARDKKALQTAAVLGQAFSLDALRHLLGDATYDCAVLIQRHLMRHQDQGFIFNHALIRDAAYGTLLRERRRELHQKAAAWLKGRDPVLTAEHLAMAGDPDAPRACYEAASSLMSRYRYEQALGLIERGLEAGGGPDFAFRLKLLQGEALLQAGDTHGAETAFSKGVDMAADPVEMCRATLGLASVRRITDDIDAALADTHKAIETALSEGLTEEAARGYLLLGNLLFPRGDIEGCFAAHAKCLEFARDAKSMELEASALGGLGDVEYLRGNFRNAYERFSECVEFAGTHGLKRTLLANLPMQVISQIWIGPLGSVYDRAEEAIAAAAAIGFDRAEMVANHSAFFACHFSGKFERALGHARRSLELARRIKAPRFEAEALVFEAWANFELGNRAGALECAHQSLAIGRKTGMSYMGPIFLGACALVAESDEELAAITGEAEELLARDAICHNHVFYHAILIDVCLARNDWQGARSHAQALADYMKNRFAPVIDLITRRGFALAGFGENPGKKHIELEEIAASARDHEHYYLLKAVEDALARADT